jgi:hypothetical protein
MEWHIDPLRRGELREGGIQDGRLGRRQKRDGRHLGEGARIGGDRPHAMGDRAARRPSTSRPRVEHRVAG